MTDSKAGRAAELFEQAQALHRQGQPVLARNMCREVLDLQPRHGGTLNLLGVLAGQSRDLQQAVGYFDQAIEVEPNDAAPHCNRGLALKELGELEAALASFDRAIALKSDDAVAYYSRGSIRHDLGHSDLALCDYERAVAIQPAFAQAYFNRGLLLQHIQRWDAALASYTKAVEIKADYAEAHANKGFVLYVLKRFEEALESYDRAIALRPVHAPTYVHRGNALKELNRLDAALTSYDRAIGLTTDYAEAYLNRGATLYLLDKIDAALESFGRAITIKPDYAEAYFNRASVLRRVRHFEAAAADYAVVAALAPGMKFLAGARLEVNMLSCDFSGFDAAVAEVAAGIERGEPVSHPFASLTFFDSPQLQRKAAEIWVREMCPPDAALGAIPRREVQAKLRIGYFSADFREHPVSRLIVEAIERHDRSRFEVIGFSFGPDDHGELRHRLERAFDKFLDVRAKSAAQIAALARSLDIDVAVDLGGYTHDSRPGIFAARAAPIQVSYLGYLGTMGAPYMDYLVADSAIIPDDEHLHYAEKIVYLPSYHASDSQRRIAGRIPTRQDLGLPAEGFVYSCFNSNYKITPATFSVWMRILARVARSTLYLYADNAAAERNLHHQARRLGVDSDRIVFGERLGLEDYLARFRAMDLFLDTLPYNAGTTANDALWAGLPVLTCTGGSFAGRVAASLLKAIDLPELIAATPALYEESAVALGSNPQRMAEIKQRLAQNRLTRPLFDSGRFTSNLETAYEQIQERYQSGLPPDHIRVIG